MNIITLGKTLLTNKTKAAQLFRILHSARGARAVISKATAGTVQALTKIAHTVRNHAGAIVRGTPLTNGTRNLLNLGIYHLTPAARASNRAQALANITTHPTTHRILRHSKYAGTVALSALVGAMAGSDDKRLDALEKKRTAFRGLPSRGRVFHLHAPKSPFPKSYVGTIAGAGFPRQRKRDRKGKFSH